jgi:hypothetical protein
MRLERGATRRRVGVYIGHDPPFAFIAPRRPTVEPPSGWNTPAANWVVLTMSTNMRPRSDRYARGKALLNKLPAHIEGALSVGATPQEIVEVILQVCLYAGFAAGTNAMLLAAEVFKAETSGSPVVAGGF